MKIKNAKIQLTFAAACFPSAWKFPEAKTTSNCGRKERQFQTLFKSHHIFRKRQFPKNMMFFFRFFCVFDASHIFWINDGRQLKISDLAFRGERDSFFAAKLEVFMMFFKMWAIWKVEIMCFSISLLEKVFLSAFQREKLHFPFKIKKWIWLLLCFCVLFSDFICFVVLFEFDFDVFFFWVLFGFKFCAFFVTS